jgi:hypothetical protein
LAVLSPLKSEKAEAWIFDFNWSSTHSTTTYLSNLDCEKFENYKIFEDNKADWMNSRRINEFEYKCVFNWFIKFNKYLEEYLQTWDEDKFKLMEYFIKSSTKRDLEKMLNFLELASEEFDWIDKLYLLTKSELSNKKEWNDESNEITNRLPDFEMEVIHWEFINRFGKSIHIKNRTNKQKEWDYFEYREWNAHIYRIPFERKRSKFPFELKVKIEWNRIFAEYELNEVPRTWTELLPKGYVEVRSWNETYIKRPEIIIDIDDELWRYGSEEIKLKFKIDNWEK